MCMRMCINMCMHVYTHGYTHGYNTYACMCIRMCIHMCIRMCIHMCIRMCADRMVRVSCPLLLMADGRAQLCWAVMAQPMHMSSHMPPHACSVDATSTRDLYSAAASAMSSAWFATHRSSSSLLWNAAPRHSFYFLTFGLTSLTRLRSFDEV